MPDKYSKLFTWRPRLLLGIELFVLVCIYLVSYGGGTYKGLRMQYKLVPTDNMLYNKILHAFDMLYGPVKISILGDIFGIGISLIVVATAFLIAQTLYSGFLVRRKTAERVAIFGALLWVFAALGWITKMPVAFIAVCIILIFIGLNKAYRWLPVLIDNENDNSKSVVQAYLTLMILNGFFWCPGFQFFCSLGIVGMALGDNVAAIYGKAKGKMRFKFLKERKTVEGTVAMFLSCMAVNTLVAVLMIHIPGIQKELFRFLIILFAATLSTLTELFSPKGYDNLLIAPLTAFPIYFYVH